MATLRSRRYLSCFYCGRRSKLRFEGQGSFDCSHCDATNWLDKNGDITDPPATTTLPAERPPVQYAIARQSTRSPSPLLSPDRADSVFCDTCLRNQHMLTNSLAQFEWPDDQNSNEYVARERRYWALRRDLEKRYPQMCADCEPKVEKRLHEASYTAQTDHLRRMMDRTRTQRREVKRRGFLDVVDAAGRWSWLIGFALQFLWHIAVLYVLVTRQYAIPGTKSLSTLATRAAQKLGYGGLPDTDRLMQWAINLSICAFPWNPRFKQTIRGFTAHLLGFRHWYTYQLLILMIRCVSLTMAQYSSSKGLPTATQLGAQSAILLLTLYVYHTSRKSIRTDMTPLFPKISRATSSQGSASRLEPRRDPNDLGNILDEISQSPVEAHARPIHHSPQGSSGRRAAVTADGASSSFSGRSRENPGARLTFGALNLADSAGLEKPESQQLQAQPRAVHYEEEMDWTPSASQYRAFSSYNPYKIKNTNPRFNDTPIEPKPGPIWYKVPPAPTTPAQRLRNPPMRPIIRESPKETKENFFKSTSRGPVDLASSSRGSLSDITFAEPTFFAPQVEDDPRDNLSNMFANSFSISPSPDDEAFRRPRSAAQNTRSRESNGDVEGGSQNHRVTRIVELSVLAGASYAWLLGLGTDEQYGLSLTLASVIACLITSIRLAADLQAEAQLQGGSRPSSFAMSRVNLALAQVMTTLVLTWAIWSGGQASNFWCMYGNAHFALAIFQHAWHSFA
ncbi:Ima1 N-terminal domain-containing protein [Durotheca rogersii]|uniref:Ima1 N-terminal domain-containing protein n=1 Tax=Durotheca rogersii TaxID=419775 RepID=UPI00221EA8BA|nr:Ima1 N-terminal domain-containing protein [Durotheca rogersii]KAI5864333.1 Ima1 N-terminal domain-containing protein [Durotheca rogersii]